MNEANAVYRVGMGGKMSLVCVCEAVEDARWISRLLAKDDSEGTEYASTDEAGDVED